MAINNVFEEVIYLITHYEYKILKGFYNIIFNIFLFKEDEKI